MQAPHSLPRRARLPVSSRPRRVGTRRGLVAAGLVCRWLPPRVHSFSGVPGRSRTGFSRFAGQAADRSPSGTRPTPGQECNTTPGRSYVQALCDNFFHYAILASTGLIFLIERLHVTVQTPLSAPSSETRTPSRHPDARWSLGRERQTRPLQEAPQTRLAEAAEEAPQIVDSRQKRRTPPGDSRLEAGCWSSGDPDRPTLGYALVRSASSTYFRRTIRLFHRSAVRGNVL